MKKYLLASVNIIEENKISISEYKSVKKSGNKMVEILAKLKSWTLPKFRLKNLSKSKQVQSTYTIEEHNFLTLDTRKVFTKLR